MERFLINFVGAPVVLYFIFAFTQMVFNPFGWPTNVQIIFCIAVVIGLFTTIILELMFDFMDFL